MPAIPFKYQQAQPGVIEVVKDGITYELRLMVGVAEVTDNERNVPGTDIPEFGITAGLTISARPK